MTDRSTPAILDQKDYAAVHGDIVALLEAARRAAARSVNAVMTASYWAVGQRIVTFEQGGQERAAYGEALIERLLARATPDNLAALAGIAGAYEGVKGYGVVKETKLEQVRKEVADAVAELETA